MPINLTKTELSIIVNEIYGRIENYQNWNDTATDDYIEKLITLYQKLKDIKNN